MTSTPEETALAKAVGLERDRTERAKMFRELERAQRDRAVQDCTTQLRDSGQDCRTMSRAQYSEFRNSMLRALRGLPPR